MSTRSLVRVLSWLLAITLFAATVLYLAYFLRSLRISAGPGPEPEPTDLVDQLLAAGDFHRQIWLLDLGSSLLFVAAFVVLILLARPLALLGRVEDARGGVVVSSLVAAGLLGVIAQLIYVGATQVTIETAYCDCGHKVEEVIAQGWASWLIQGAVGWLINGTGVFLVIGLAAAGSYLGGTVMPSGWRTLSYVTAAVLALNVLDGIFHVAGPVGPLLLAISTGILVPVWAIWLARRVSRGDDTEAGATA